jgi:hypothetical protein
MRAVGKAEVLESLAPQADYRWFNVMMMIEERCDDLLVSEPLSRLDSLRKLSRRGKWAPDTSPSSSVQLSYISWRSGSRYSG